MGARAGGGSGMGRSRGIKLSIEQMISASKKISPAKSAVTRAKNRLTKAEGSLIMAQNAGARNKAMAEIKKAHEGLVKAQSNYDYMVSTLGAMTSAYQKGKLYKGDIL